MGSKFFHLLIVFLGMSIGLQAQPNVSAALDSSKILLGDQVRLHINVDHAPGESILGADFGALEKIPEIEILATGPWDTIRSGDRFVLQQNLTLTSFDSGYYQIPPIPIQYRQANGQVAAVMTNDLALAVDMVFMPGDSVQLAPIKPIIEEPVKLTDYLLFFGVALGVLLIAGLIYFFYQRRQRDGQAPKVPEVIRPAHEVALEKLTELKAKKLWQQGELKRYHSELTYILREYIERRYEAPALESTTPEIMRSLQLKALDEDLYNRLQTMLQLADLVKFAKAEPPPERHEQALEEAEHFVEETKWTPPEEVEGEEPESQEAQESESQEEEPSGSQDIEEPEKP